MSAFQVRARGPLGCWSWVLGMLLLCVTLCAVWLPNGRPTFATGWSIPASNAGGIASPFSASCDLAFAFFSASSRHGKEQRHEQLDG